MYDAVKPLTPEQLKIPVGYSHVSSAYDSLAVCAHRAFRRLILESFDLRHGRWNTAGAKAHADRLDPLLKTTFTLSKNEGIAINGCLAILVQMVVGLDAFMHLAGI